MKEDMDSVSKTVQLDVVELLKQVLQWTPLYKPGLNKALLQAAKVGSTGCIKVLLSTGADVDAEDENGDTPFVHAFRGKHKEVMEMLKEAGCTTEIVKMSLALATHDVDFVKFCNQLDIPIENEDWNTCNEEEVKILLNDLEIDPFVGQYGTHGYDDSPFLYLASEGSPELLQVLVDEHPCIEKYTQEDINLKMNNALHKAIRSHRFDNVKLLIGKLGAQLEAKDRRGRSAFLAACEYDEEIACYLLELGADFSQSDREGLTPLHWACCGGFMQLCMNLTAKNQDVNVSAKLGATPLMVASSGGHISIAQYLIDHGATVNLGTPEGWTALHVAVWANAPGCVQLLLNSNANPDVQSRRLTHNSDVVPGSTPLLIAIFLNSMKMFRQLLDANCNVNLAGLVCKKMQDEGIQMDTLTPIQFAIASCSWDFAELLIRAGCNVQPVKMWIMDDKQCPVKIPLERLAELRRMVKGCVHNPYSLQDLCRRLVRHWLGHNLPGKVDRLNVINPVKHSILLSDLFQPPAGEGSFEI